MAIGYCEFSVMAIGYCSILVEGEWKVEIDTWGVEHTSGHSCGLETEVTSTVEGQGVVAVCHNGNWILFHPGGGRVIVWKVEIDTWRLIHPVRRYILLRRLTHFKPHTYLYLLQHYVLSTLESW
jgi:hypothetical protein